MQSLIRVLIVGVAVMLMGAGLGTPAWAETRLTIGEQDYQAMLRDGYGGGVKCSHLGCAYCAEVRIGATCTWRSSEELRAWGASQGMYLPPPPVYGNPYLDAGRGMIEGLQRATPPPPIQCHTQPNGSGWSTSCR
jgi:hypothetical protein